MPKRRHSGEGFPYDATPDVHHFPGVPRSSFDVVNMYGTYNIQPTSDTFRFATFFSRYQRVALRFNAIPNGENTTTSNSSHEEEFHRLPAAPRPRS